MGGVQEDCFKVKKQTVAGLYFLHCKTCEVGPPPSVIDLNGVPEAALFRRLDRLAEREAPNIKPGKLLIAVYGDNWCAFAPWLDLPMPLLQSLLHSPLPMGRDPMYCEAGRFSKASYTLAAHMMAPDTAATAEAVEAVDARVLAKRDDLCAFEKSFNKVRPPAAAKALAACAQAECAVGAHSGGVCSAGLRPRVAALCRCRRITSL